MRSRDLANESWPRTIRRSAGRAAGLAPLALTLPLAFLAFGCSPDPRPAPGAGFRGDAPEYELIRANEELIRVETRTGRTWRTSITGDGGWQGFGDTAPAAGRAGYPGRYQVSFIPPTRNVSSRRVPIFLRFDKETGRMWVMPSEMDEEWLQVEGESFNPSVDMPSGAAASATGVDPLAVGARPDLALDLPSPSDMPAIEGSDSQAEENIQAFAEAVDKEHLPTEIRVWSVEQLGRYDADRAGPILVRALDSSDPQVVVAAIGAIQRVGYASAIPRITQLQQHTDERVRTASAAAIKQY